MSYITVSDLVPGAIEERLAVQLTNDEVGGTDVVTAVVEQAITDAEAVVNGYLGARLALPLVTVPDLVVTLTRDVAIYKLHARRPWTLTDEIRKFYEDAIARLRDISKGLIVLDVPEPSPNPARLIRTNTIPRVFGRSNLSGF